MDKKSENPFRYHTLFDILGERDPELLKRLGLFPSEEMGETVDELREFLSSFF